MTDGPPALTTAAAERPLPRLLFVMNAPIVGGAERHTLELAAWFAAIGGHVCVFAMKPGPVAAPEGVALLQPGSRRSLGGRIVDLGRAIGDVRPDVIVTVNERPLLASVIARRLARSRTPIAAVYHSTLLRSPREKLMQLGYTPLFNRVESVIFISANQRSYWRARGFAPRHDLTILNGIDTDRFSPGVRAALRGGSRQTLGLADNELVIGLCAVMRPEKNHLQLVAAVARLRQQGVPAVGLMVGDGPMRPAIERHAAALGVTGHLRLVGMQQDVRPFVAAFDIGLLCSVAIETLSLAALEVMAMGVPMVLSDIGGASEIVDGTNGRLFPVSDATALHGALMALADPALRTASGAAARRRVEERFDRRKMLEAYRASFMRLSGRG